MSVQIQLYNGKKDNQGTATDVANTVSTIYGSEEQKSKIEQLRSYRKELERLKITLDKATPDEKEKWETLVKKQEQLIDKKKGELPAVTWSGTFNTRKATEIKEYSGLMCLDIDKLPPAELITIKNKLKQNMHTHICFTSPSGNGLKVIVRTDATPETHKRYFLAIEKYYNKSFGIEIDKSGKDVSRLCFLSYDEDLYFSDFSSTWQLSMIESIETKTAYQTSIPHTPEKNEQTKLSKKQETELSSTEETPDNVFEFTSKVITYTEGNRNRFIYLFANNCNRKGISMADCSNYSFSNFTDREAEELRQTIENAYNNNAHEFAKYKKGTTKQASNSNNNTKEDTPKKFTQFWRKYKIKKGKGEEAYEKEIIELNRVDFSDFLFQQGFHLLHTGKTGYQLCKSGEGIIKPVEPHHIKQHVLKWCREHSLKDVEEMMRKGQKQYFAANELDALPYKEVEVKRDTKEHSFFYFKNCWVSVSKDEITTHPYSELKEYIWEGNKIDKDFTLDEQKIDDENGNVSPNHMTCEYARFLYFFSYNPKNPDEKEFDAETINQRFWSIATSYGFLLDGYKHPAERKGIFAVDHKIGEKGEQNGRTGKSIIPKAASYLKVVAPINGKSFKPDYQFKYEQITRDTQIVNFNDMQRNFDVEQIFEVIADDYSVIRRANGYVDFKYTDSPKVYYSTNFTPSGEGSSYSGRMHVIEASDYFSDTHSPYDEFKHSMFTDWDAAEWNRFFNFSLLCVQALKGLGLLKYPKSNFDMRKLVNSVVPEFIDFMDADWLVNDRVEKVAVLDKFNETYQKLYGNRLKPHTFHKWVKSYAKNRNLAFNPHKNGGYDKSNGKEFYVLANADFKPDKLQHTTSVDLFNGTQL